MPSPLPAISINGSITDATHATISPLDRGFTLGDGVFETLKVTNKTPWYLDRHVRRLTHATQTLGITYPESLPTWIDALIQHTASDAFSLRITVSRGTTDTPGLAPSSPDHPTTVIVAAAPPNIPPTFYERGLTAAIASAPRNERSRIAGLKTTNYIESILAFQEARAAGYDDTIFLDSNHFVSEASASNVFICIGGALVTPSQAHGILPGITRAVVLELANQLNIPTAERDITVSELTNADEAFLTSSLRGLVPLVKIADDPIGSGTPGQITRQLAAAYETQPSRI